MRNTSLSDKLILYFLLISLSAIAMVGFYSFYNARKALLNRTFDQLTSVRVARKKQIEQFFNDRIKELKLISTSKEALNLINYRSQMQAGSKNQDRPSTKYKSDLDLNWYFFYYLQSGNNYKGLYFINGDSDIVKINYTNPDSVTYQPADAEIKNYYLTTIKNNLLEPVKIFDYTFDSAKQKPRMLIASRVPGSKKNKTGIFLAEISVDVINFIMLEKNPQDGLGKSGEVYLVGPDFLLRSASRFEPNSILQTQVHTNAAISALSDHPGSGIIRDYRNIRVLSSYSKLDIPGLDWVILSEIDYDEATTPIYRIRNNILFLTIILSVIIFIVTYIFSKRITLPLNRLKNATANIASGELNVVLQNKSKDEIGQLTESFNTMTLQLKEKEKELQSERMKSLSAMIDGQEKERQRLSRELHDGLGQSMIALSLKLEGASGTDICKIGKTIKEVKSSCNETINEIRRISNDLMPAVLDEFGITTALKNMCDQITENSGIHVEFHFQGEVQTLDKHISTYIFRIAQEALNNIIKHSEATEAEVRLLRNNSEIILTIRDKGKGFSVDDPASLNGNGLYNMKERVSLLNGSFEIRSSLTAGTTITSKIPINSIHNETDKSNTG